MNEVCCRFYPGCYCVEVPRDPAHNQRMRLLREGTPGDPLQLDQVLRGEARRRRRIALAIMFIVLVTFAGLVLASTLAGCGPDDGVIKSPAPEPTTTEMFTVIRPPAGHLAGGIYDNN